jgi:hypothetical protein
METATKVVVLALAAMAFGVFVPAASASVIGTLDFGICPGGDITVTLTTIDFILPVGGGLGCMVSGAANAITYTSGSVGTGVSGTVNDLGFPPPGSGNTDFIQFAGNPTLHFDLTTIGPVPPGTGTSCSFTFSGPSCVVAAGSEFLLTPSGGGTTVTLNVSGLAHDLSATGSTWLGAFTTQFPGVSAASLQAMILTPGGSITKSYSFSGLVTPVSSTPEPLTMALIGTGLIAFAVFGLRKRRAQ